MKRIAFVVCVVVLVFGAAILARTQTASVEQEVIKLENEWGEAIVKRDAASIDMLKADEFIEIYDGSAFTKAQYFEFVKSMKEEILSFVMDEWQVRVYGDAGVVMARSTTKTRLAGKKKTKQMAFLDHW